MNSPTLIRIAALNMLAAVALGAFGAHGLTRIVAPAMLEIWRTGVLYHLIHALGLFAVALLMSLPRLRARPLAIAGGCMLAGIVLFSGSLYALAISGQIWFGMLAPVGGTLFMLAWALVAWAAWGISSRPNGFNNKETST